MEFTGERYSPEKFKSTDEISTIHLKRYEFALNFAQGLCVLDIASGEGYGSNLLASKAKSVIGIDIDKEAVEFSKAKYKNDNLSFQQGSIDNIPLPDSSIDIIVSFETIEHVGEKIQKAFMKEISRILKPSGRLIMSTPDKDIYGEGHNKFHIKEMNMREFSNKLKKYFPDVIFYGQDVRLYKNKISLLIIRILHKMIKLDKLQIRHKIFPKKIRAKIDEKLLSSSAEKIDRSSTLDNQYPVKLKAGETAMYLIVVCKR